MNRLLKSKCAFLLLLAAFPACFAQAQTARFSGTVMDDQNAIIPGATVTVINQTTKAELTAKSDPVGAYVIPYLSAGTYKLSVEADGFDPAVTSGIVLKDAQLYILDAHLKIGKVKTTVDVQSASAIDIETHNAEVSGIVIAKEVVGIGLNGRNFTQLLTLVPGVSNQTGQDEARVGPAGSVKFSINGGRTEYNNYDIDGASVLNTGINRDNSSLIVTPSLDAINDVRVLTSNYGAIYGNTASGTTLVTTKSGTKSFHGGIYFFFRNEALNSKGFKDVGINSQGVIGNATRAPQYRRLDFGGTFGGPVFLPHLYENKAKRTFFFLSEEIRIEKDPYPYRQAVPSDAERGGDFTADCDSGGNSIFSRSQDPDCPASQHAANVNTYYSQPKLPILDRNGVAMLNTNAIPHANSIGGCNGGTMHSTDTLHPDNTEVAVAPNCFLAEVSLPTYYQEELVRIDHDLTPAMRLTARYIYDHWHSTVPIPQWSSTVNSFPTIQNRFDGPGQSLVVTASNVVSPSLINQFIASFTESHIHLTDVPLAGVSLNRQQIFDVGCTTVMASISQCPLGYLFQNGYGSKNPGVVVAGNNAEYGGTGFAAAPGYTPWDHTNPIYSFSDNVSKTLPHHTIQAGIQYVNFQRNQQDGPGAASTGSVQSTITFSDLNSAHTTGNAFADLLTLSSSQGFNNSAATNVGAVASVQQDSGQVRYHQRYRILEPYLQDDWNPLPGLTINAGVRLSIFGNYHEADERVDNWVPSAYNPGLAVAVNPVAAGTSLVPSGALLDTATGTPLRTYQSNGQVDPRVVNGLVRCGANAIPASCQSSHLFNWAPRVGVAWSTPDSKTAFRAGYGIFYEHGTPAESNTGSLEGSAPGVMSVTQRNPISLEAIGNNGTAFPLSVTSIPTHTVWPYAQQFSFSIERQVQRNTAASVGFVGSKGTHLTAERQLNQLKPVDPSQNPFGLHEPFSSVECTSQTVNGSVYGFESYNYKDRLLNGTTVTSQQPAFVNIQAACTGYGVAPDPNALRQYAPGLGEIYSLENIADSKYNSLQATIRHTTNPLTVTVAYTFSHSIDDSSDRSDTTFVNSFDIRTNRASSNFDQRHILNVGYVAKLPLLSGVNHLIRLASRSAVDHAAILPNSLLGRVFGAWNLSGVTTYQSGIPFSVINGASPQGVSLADNAGVANGAGLGSYPDLAPNHVKLVPHSTNNFGGVGPLLLDPGMFVAPRGLTFGNSSRNILNNPARTNWDMALLKDFPAFRDTGFEFRAEAFNVFNTTQYRIYDPNLGNGPGNTISCYANSFPLLNPSASAGFSAAGGDGTDCLTGSSFLHPVDAHRPRTLQLGLKFNY